MKVKVSESSGAVLNWMVATCDGYSNLRKNTHRFDDGLIMTPPNKDYGPVYLYDLPYSTSWEYGGPIIDREGIEICKGNPLYFPKGNENGDHYEPLWMAGKMHGTTLLIAAMRCYVTSKLGDEVDVPEALINMILARES